MAGYGSLADAVEVETDLGEQGFLAVYRRAGEPVAVLSLDQPRPFVRWRKTLVASLGQLPEIHRRSSRMTPPSTAPPQAPTTPRPVEQSLASGRARGLDPDLGQPDLHAAGLQLRRRGRVHRRAGAVPRVDVVLRGAGRAT